MKSWLGDTSNQLDPIQSNPIQSTPLQSHPNPIQSKNSIMARMTKIVNLQVKAWSGAK